MFQHLNEFLLTAVKESAGPSYVVIQVPINWVLVVGKKTANKNITSKQISPIRE